MNIAVVVVHVVGIHNYIYDIYIFSYIYSSLPRPTELKLNRLGCPLTDRQNNKSTYIFVWMYKVIVWYTFIAVLMYVFMWERFIVAEKRRLPIGIATRRKMCTPFSYQIRSNQMRKKFILKIIIINFIHQKIYLNGKINLLISRLRQISIICDRPFWMKSRLYIFP